MMAKIGELGDYTSGNQPYASDNRRIPLETIQRDKQRVLHEGQITFGNYWTKPTQSLQAITDQMLTHPQYSCEPHLRPAQHSCNRTSEWVSPLGQKNSQIILWENSIGSIQRLAEQTSNHSYTTMCSGNNDPCHKLTLCFPNKGPPDAPFSVSEVNHQQSLPKVSIQKRMLTDDKRFGPSFPVGNTLPSASHQFCSEYFKKQRVMSIQSEVDSVDRIVEDPYKKRKQFFVTVSENNTGFVADNVILVDQMVRQTYQGACIPKDNHHEKHVHQKAVAVVTPLAKQVVPCATFSKNLTKLNEGCAEFKSVPDKQDQQPYVLHALRKNESGSKFPCNNTGRAPVSKHTQSESVLASEVSDLANVAASELNSEGERFCSIRLGGFSRGTKESAVSSQKEDHNSTDILQQNNVTVAKKIYGRTRTMDMESTDIWSSIPITEWSLQSLRTLVADSEQMQKKKQKCSPCIDLPREIVKLYWNGDYQKLRDAVRSGHYINIMKQVHRHSGTENTVVLKEISKEELDHAKNTIHIFKPDTALPKMVNKSSCFNLNDLLCTDMENGYPSSLTCCSKPKTADGVAAVEEQKIIEEAENDQTNTDNTSSEAVFFSQTQTMQLPKDHEKSSISVMRAEASMKAQMCMDNNNKRTNEDGEILKQKKSSKECLSKQSSVMTVNVRVNVNRATAMELSEMESENKGNILGREIVEQEQPLMDCMNKPSSTMAVNHGKKIINGLSAAELVEAQGETEEMNLEKSPCNEGCLPLSLNKQSPDMNVEPLGLPASLQIPPSDSCDANCTDPFAFVKISILSPEEAKRFFSGESNEQVENKEKDISAQPFTDNSDQVIVKLLDGISEHKKHVDIKSIKPTERNNGSHTTEQVNDYCCLSKWFQVLGYGIDELCMCEKKAELNPGIEASGEGVKETNGSINTTAKTCVTSPPVDHASMDELDVLSNEDMPKIANVMSENLMDDSRSGSHDSTKKRKRCTLMRTCQKRKINRNGCKPDINSDGSSHMDLTREMNTFLPLPSIDNGIHVFGVKSKDTINLESEKNERVIHLSLYGSSQLNRNKIATNSCIKRKICGIRSSDEMQLPAETINIMVGSDCTDYSNNRSQITKDHILSSCRSSQVPSERFTDNRRSENLESEITLELKIDCADTSASEMGTLSTAFDDSGTLLACKDGSEAIKTTFSSASADQQKNRDRQSKNKQHSASWAKMKKRQKKGSKSVRSCFEVPRILCKSPRKSSKGLLLDFKVLPESFNLAHDVAATAAEQSADTKTGPKVKTLSQKKKICGNTGAWCVSPWKKWHFKSVQASDMSGSYSTFQEFKRRYEQTQQKLDT